MFDNIENQEGNRSLNCADPRDFRYIYNETMSLLMKVAWRIVNDDEVAEDLVHDSLIKANEKALVFPSLNDAKFWLIRVVKNAALNYAKRKTRERKAYEKALYEDNREQTTGEKDLIDKETEILAKAALDKMPKNLKEVLVLKEYGELNYKEIGKVLGISEGNVKIRMFRAREKFEKIVNELLEKQERIKN